MHVVTDINGDVTQMDEVVLAYEPNRRLELDIQSPPGRPEGFVEHAVFSLDDLGGRTRVAAVADSTYRGVKPRLFEPLLTASAQKAIEEDLARLKANVEAEK